jgi:hypothetical protein
VVRGKENPRFTEVFVFQIRWKKFEGVEGKRREKEEEREEGGEGESGGGQPAAQPPR